MTAVRLGVNVDHVATLRQARGTSYPDPVDAALIAEQAGADQITVHLREDRRHIVDRDLPGLKAELSIPLNLEMAVTSEMQMIALGLMPGRVTLVPEKRQERTTEGGLDVAGGYDRIAAMVSALQSGGVDVSLFIDPDEEQIVASARTGCVAVELHTGDYADALDQPMADKEFQQLKSGSRMAKAAGLEVAAGHGLHLRNTSRLLEIPEIVELNIGHSIIARSVFVGMKQAVLEMLKVMGR
jgi:pyridoxine 5-phosphate synthase